MTEREEFVPYGKEWRDELMRIKKADLINLLELSYKNGRVLESKIKALQSENESLLNIIGNYEKVRKRMNKIVELTDSELTEIS